MAKIDANFPVSLPSALPARRAGSGPVGQAQASSGVGATAAARDVSDAAVLRHAPRSDAPVDAAKVAQLRAAVLDGSYKPNAANIAGRMIDMEKKLP